MRVIFKEVGRQKLSWESQEDNITEDRLFNWLFEEIKQRNALMSEDIVFKLDTETGEGSIIVGGFRKVGDFKIL